MSSVVAFLRALVMLACVLAVPALAVSHGAAVSRGLQAAARFLDRVSADETADPPVTREALRSARPAPRAPSESLDVGPKSGDLDSLRFRLLPQPLEEREAGLRTIPGVAEESGFERGLSAVHSEPEPRTPQPAEEQPHMAVWQQTATALQQLGAVEYALEKWGDSGELYRFRCLAAVQGTGAYQRHFQAVDSDGGRAVEQVVEQVRAWRDRAAGDRGQ